MNSNSKSNPFKSVSIENNSNFASTSISNLNQNRTADNEKNQGTNNFLSSINDKKNISEYDINFNLKDSKFIKRDSIETFDEWVRGIGNHYLNNNILQETDIFNIYSENLFNINEFNIKENFGNDLLPCSNDFITNTFNNQFKEEYSDEDFSKNFLRKENNCKGINIWHFIKWLSLK